MRDYVNELRKMVADMVSEEMERMSKYFSERYHFYDPSKPKRNDRVSESYNRMSVAFDDRREAVNVLRRMEMLVSDFGSADVMDLCDLSGVESDYRDCACGWTTLEDALIVGPEGGVYFLRLPAPVRLSEKKEEEEPAFTLKQIERVDEVDNAVFELCKVLTEDDDLEWNVAFIGRIAELAGRVMEEYNLDVRYPTKMLDTSDHVTSIEDYPFKAEKTKDVRVVDRPHKID